MAGQASVPLTNNSVFVPATPPPSGTISNDSGYTLNSNRARSESVTNSLVNENGSVLNDFPITPPIGGGIISQSPVSSSSRRSRAHQLRLLGLHSDGMRIMKEGEGASEDVLLTGLSSSSPITKFSSQMMAGTSKNRSNGFEDDIHEENQFGIGRSSEDDHIELEDGTTSKPNPILSPKNSPFTQSRTDHNRPSTTYDELDLEAGDQARNPFNEEEEDDYFNEGYNDNYSNINGMNKLPFEPIVRRERIWMWTSTAFVVALSIVSISIATGWIDWPGDGIGKN